MAERSTRIAEVGSSNLPRSTNAFLGVKIKNKETYMNRKKLGRWGEAKASAYLQKKGYEILGRNFKRERSRFLKSEIDIVARKKETLCFVEVKTLSSRTFITPEEHVTKDKIRKIINTAESYLVENGIALDSPWQIDIVSVLKTAKDRIAKDRIEIKHFENVASYAYRCEERK